jgi:SAM-dependent methyltransferase
VAFYRIYQQRTGEAAETHGQCWAGETVAENIQLCEAQTILPLFLQYLPKQGRILESGCGLGRWVVYLSRLGYNILGIDLSQDAIAAAKAFDPDMPVMLDDVLHSNFPDGSFDAAISLGVVEHFEEGPNAALMELSRLLRPGGLLFISVPLQNFVRVLFFNHLKDLVRFWRKRKGVLFDFEEYRYTRIQFEKFLAATGFEVITVVPDDFIPPRNLGVYTDVRILRSRSAKWELNAWGKLFSGLARRISPWADCAGAFWVCRRVH